MMHFSSIQGMTVSNEGFVAVMTSKESSRALRVIMTPDDPMSGGLDMENAETSEARTLLQLMQVCPFNPYHLQTFSLYHGRSLALAPRVFSYGTAAPRGRCVARSGSRVLHNNYHH